MKIVVIIPAYNEEKSLGAVILDLRSHGYLDLVVIDDGSDDNTKEVAGTLKVPVLRHVINRGLGAALGTGFEYAKIQRADIVVTFDSDGQHKAEDINGLLEPITKHKADMVIGSRMLNSEGMPIDRKVINYLANIITYFLYGVWTTDSQSGLRAFNGLALGKIQIKTQRMEVSSEFFKEIKRNNLRFVETPIKPIYTEYSQIGGQDGRGNLNSLRVGAKMILRLFR